jgi:hypothetical protein
VPDSVAVRVFQDETKCFFPLLGSLREPLKTIQEQLGDAWTGSLSLDLYPHAEWNENDEAAKLSGNAIENSVNSVSSTAIQTRTASDSESEAIAAYIAKIHFRF